MVINKMKIVNKINEDVFYLELQRFTFQIKKQPAQESINLIEAHTCDFIYLSCCLGGTLFVRISKANLLKNIDKADR